ncbi:MAG: hypothetical protein HC802_17320, partial [Caldilineaceae bacterium]|nr:hypothetical protein [Caldilineaceae bacterium]
MLTGRISLAVLVTFGSFVVAVGMTHAASPSLYQAYCALMICWLLMKDAEKPHDRWLFLAGLIAAGGLDVGIACGVEQMSHVPLGANVYNGPGTPRTDPWPWDDPPRGAVRCRR